MNEIDISEDYIPPPRSARRLHRYLGRLLRHLHMDGWQISVLLCDDTRMRSLNQQYRHIDAPTDVLSFRQHDAEQPVPVSAGDIVISLDTMKRNADAAGVSYDREIKRLTIHGILHLCGMDHDEEQPDDEMLLLQDRLLNHMSGRRIL